MGAPLYRYTSKVVGPRFSTFGSLVEGNGNGNSMATAMALAMTTSTVIATDVFHKVHVTKIGTIVCL
jgi:hypothetical protein